MKKLADEQLNILFHSPCQGMAAIMVGMNLVALAQD
jgi:hypothetical protein